jgi:hypothetical protein
MLTEARLYKACWVMFYITIATATIVTAFIYLSQKRPTEVFYAITVESSVYHYPHWNITLKAKQDIPLELHSVQIYYKGVKVLEKTIKAIKLEEGDCLILTSTFASYNPGENFTLFLRFDKLMYQQFPLMLPENS